MAKYLGSVELYDDNGLREIENANNFEVIHSAVWDEAEEYMEENGADEAEVRVRSLDYIQVFHSEK